MAGLTISVTEVISIMRNVTGRNDVSDPQFTDGVMFDYLQNFIQLELPSEIRIFPNYTWYRFNIDENSADPLPVTLASSSGPSPTDLGGSGSGFSTIEPPCYVGGFEVFWYQDPTQFFRIWPETTTYSPSRPTYVLWYNNELVFRNPPDDQYEVKVRAYAIPETLDYNGNVDPPYLCRYLAYGAALDLFADYGEMDRVQEYTPMYRRYKNQITARTWQQMFNQRTTPSF